MKKEIIYSKQASNFLVKIPEKDSTLIKSKIKQYAENSEELKNNVKKLKGINLNRLRVGSYRVIFDDRGLILYIEKIGLRKNVYEGLK